MRNWTEVYNRFKNIKAKKGHKYKCKFCGFSGLINLVEAHIWITHYDEIINFVDESLIHE